MHVSQVSQVLNEVPDADQRLTEDLELLCNNLADTFPDIIKPIADLSWFSYQTVRMLGFRNTALLYAYMVAGLGVLRVVAPDFGTLVAKMQNLQVLFGVSNKGVLEAQFVKFKRRAHFGQVTHVCAPMGRALHFLAETSARRGPFRIVLPL